MTSRLRPACLVPEKPGSDEKCSIPCDFKNNCDVLNTIKYILDCDPGLTGLSLCPQ